MSEYNTITLENGLRIIHRPSDSPIVYCGFQIAAGTRDEAPGEEGLAHFCEHITFKGTERRNALQVINCLEEVGGELNAFTNKETTVFYAALQKEHFRKAVDLLTDIVFHSTYPQAEIDKEVEVICDEIESYLDSPAEQIYDDFENIIFRGHPLGHNILGTAERVRSFTSEDAKRFTAKYYRPENAVFFIYGTPPQPSPQGEGVLKILSSIERKGDFDDTKTNILETKNVPIPSKQTSLSLNSPSPCGEGRGGVISRSLHCHQAHVMLGTRAYDIHSPRRIALYLINNILGGPGMNARLNLTLRERHGLVYTVESTMVSYGDTGLWTTYFGCDQKDVNRCLRLIRKELDKVIDRPLSQAQLRKAKRQIKGQIALACENKEQFAIDFGKSFLHYGWERDITSLYEKIEQITAEDIQAVARELFTEDRLTTLIYK